MLKPDFKYYKLDRDLAYIDDTGRLDLYKNKAFPESKSMHADIINTVMASFKYEETDSGKSKQDWVNALAWSWFNWLPNYFFTAPASATRKYHPAWANRPDGLLLHSLAVVRVAASLTDLIEIGEHTYNTLLFAAWHHDMFKYGEIDEYKSDDMTVHEHPVLAGEFFLLPQVREIMAKFHIDDKTCDLISDLICTHAGPYRSSTFSPLKLPECKGQLNKLLYKADYIASRKETDWVKDVLAEIPDPE